MPTLIENGGGNIPICWNKERELTLMQDCEQLFIQTSLLYPGLEEVEVVLQKSLWLSQAAEWNLSS